ncbi:hypothetical protein [Ilumatobacter sp.]|uniref:hypothetical protein n=1 Tax=Ilumatobacter sp. TaxID=1967498 RepID=UPI003750DAA3
MQPQGHLFSVREASEVFDVSADTIRRRLKADEFENAFKDTIDGSETWQIPIGDLLGAGFKLLPAAAPSDDSPTIVEPVALTDRVEDQSEVDELRSLLVEARHRAELAEKDVQREVDLRAVSERIITALEGQVRALQAGPQTAAVGPVVLTEPVATAPLRKKSWWRR